ncbi:MAG: glycosyl hydrolase family 8 [Acetobacteraceae bacterium]|nr:glycosyl hydrolase family 8 [Acetobacteraceae bacterium]
MTGPDTDAGWPGQAHRLTRRAALSLAGLGLPGLAAASALPAAWAAFRARFLAPDGRIVDTGNEGISHSEGQGFGLLFAVAAGDRPSFDLILGFARGALRRKGDSLHAWKWDPSTTPRVQDPNNATDGDLYIAWGLARGAARWHDRALAEEARAIARDLLRLTMREAGGRRVLLPGAQGFENGSIVLNPSYAVFPAWRSLNILLPDPVWARLEADHLALLREARFGERLLPPDWLELPRNGGRPAPAGQWPPRFSFDAVRVPLLLAWAGHARHPAARAAVAFWSDPRLPYVPAWVDLRDGSLAPFPASAGVIAIHRLVVALQLGERRLALLQPPPDEDYYSAALRLLVLLAAADLGITVA